MCEKNRAHYRSASRYPVGRQRTTFISSIYTYTIDPSECGYAERTESLFIAGKNYHANHPHLTNIETLNAFSPILAWKCRYNWITFSDSSLSYQYGRFNNQLHRPAQITFVRLLFAHTFSTIVPIQQTHKPHIHSHTLTSFHCGEIIWWILWVLDNRLSGGWLISARSLRTCLLRGTTHHPLSAQIFAGRFLGVPECCRCV